jgi:ABC-type multidrug transport system ATPase subunit
VQDLSLAVRSGEVFGLLGPNGAGKTTAINMLTGLLEPSAGSAWVAGLDLATQRSHIYKLMGVCPQHDLLWEQLSGREHLRFYGRLKGLTGEPTTNTTTSAGGCRHCCCCCCCLFTAGCWCLR